MATRRSARAAVSVALGVLLTTTSGGAAAVAAPAAQRDGVAAVIASYQAQIPELMSQQHIPGLALARGRRRPRRVAAGLRPHRRRQQRTGHGRHDLQRAVDVEGVHGDGGDAGGAGRAPRPRRADHDLPAGLHGAQRVRASPGAEDHAADAAQPHRGLHPRGAARQQLRAGARATFDAHVRSISDTWLRFPVGTGYAYSNLGIDLAGYILEQVWKEPFPAVMRDSLLAPLGMDHSTFDRGPGARDRRPGGGSLRLAGATARGHPDDRRPAGCGPAPRTWPSSWSSSWATAPSTVAPSSTPR